MKLTKQMSSLIVRALLIVALVFGLAPLAEAQTLAAKGKPVAAKAKSPATAKPSGAQHEGIKVHGHWIIEVRNPDGTLVSHHEFENALDPSSGQLLPTVLLGLMVADLNSWRIRVGDACGSSSAPAPCTIPVTPNPFVPNSTTVFSGTLELAGSTTASRDATITRVETVVDFNPVQGAILLSPRPNTVFTDRILSSTVNVVTGQIVQVKVVISFS